MSVNFVAVSTTSPPVARIPQYTIPYLIMRHVVHISVTKYCIARYLSNALWDLWDGFMESMLTCYQLDDKREIWVKLDETMFLLSIKCVWKYHMEIFGNFVQVAMRNRNSRGNVFVYVVFAHCLTHLHVNIGGQHLSAQSANPPQGQGY